MSVEFIVIYPGIQEEEALATVIEAIERLLLSNKISNDSLYTPRYCLPLYLGSPIHLAQGSGYLKFRDPSYRKLYGKDGLFLLDTWSLVRRLRDRFN